MDDVPVRFEFPLGLPNFDVFASLTNRLIQTTQSPIIPKLSRDIPIYSIVCRTYISKSPTTNETIQLMHPPPPPPIPRIHSLSPRTYSLYTHTFTHHSFVHSYIHRNTELTPLLDTKLVDVDIALLTRAFIAGNTVTVADFAYYATVHEACASECEGSRILLSRGIRILAAEWKYFRLFDVDKYMI